MNNNLTEGQLLQLQSAQQAGGLYAQGFGYGVGIGLIVGIILGMFVIYIIKDIASLIGYYVRWWHEI